MDRLILGGGEGRGERRRRERENMWVAVTIVSITA